MNPSKKCRRRGSTCPRKASPVEADQTGLLKLRPLRFLVPKHASATGTQLELTASIKEARAEHGREVRRTGVVDMTGWVVDPSSLRDHSPRALGLLVGKASWDDVQAVGWKKLGLYFLCVLEKSHDRPDAL